jgi:hypothetical protein
MRQKTQIRNTKGEITTNNMEIQGILTDYFENLNFNTFANLEEIDKFLNTCDHPKLNHLNRYITKMKLKDQ